MLEVRGREGPDGPPIAWVFVEREETSKSYEGVVYEASIRLNFEIIQPTHSFREGGKGYFTGSYSKSYGGQPYVSLTSGVMQSGAVFLDLPGLEGNRIGTYLMNQIVLWTKQWPDASVNPIKLISSQARGENKQRRNRFYEQFGIEFDYSSSAQEEGVSRVMLAASLVEVDAWKANIAELNVRDYVGDILYQCQRQAANSCSGSGTMRSGLSTGAKRMPGPSAGPCRRFSSGCRFFQ